MADRHNKKTGSRKKNSRKKDSRKRTGLHAGVAIGVICAALFGGLIIFGFATGKFSNLVEADDTSMESEADIEAQDKAAEEAAAEKQAQEEAEAAAEKKAAEEAAEKERQAAEAKLKEEHPEFFADIQLTMPDGSIREINRELVQTWETDNGDGTYTKDDAAFDQHITAFVAELASETDTVGADHTFSSTGCGIQTIPGNQYYGWQVDQEAEIAAIRDELNSSTETTREPHYTMRESANSNDNGGIGQTYCEIDASRQHLWIYQNGSLAFETDVVTGLMDEAHYTPAGVYLLLSKERDATLLGEKLPNGERTYETPVSYWMPFTDTGIGLHDAWWKSVFGEGQNEWNGSHGCVNLPSDVAGTVYDLMTMETPIVVYYSQAYTLREAPESEVDKYIRQQQEAAAQAAAEQAAAEQAAAEQAAAEQAAAEQAAAEQAAAEQAAAEQAAAEQAAAEQAAAEQAAAEQAAAEQAAAEQAAAEQAASSSTSTVTSGSAQ